MPPHGTTHGREDRDGPGARPVGGRRIWVGTNWKMTKTIAETRAFIDVIAGAEVNPLVHPFILPPHTTLAVARERLPTDCPVLLGAQNAHWGAEGACTGEVSMHMVADAGASLVMIGHSERREQFGETDKVVALKVRAALDAGLTPIVCVGESATVRATGGAPAFVSAQVAAALEMTRPAEVTQVMFAYEPVWAIGDAGRPARPEEVAPVFSEITDRVTDTSQGRLCLALLYGGSVDQGNASAFLEVDKVDGLFVGRSAWTPAGLLRLVDTAGQRAQHASRR